MDKQRMLHIMCQEELSNADVQAIVKVRGFSKNESKTRALFEHFYLTDIGLDAAFDGLTEKEIIALHLLNFSEQAVEVSFFSRIYVDASVGKKYYHGTFTQQYTPVYKEVRERLVRRGVLMMAEDQYSGKDTKMERRRCRFPREFAAYLPPVFGDVAKLEAKGMQQKDGFRNNLIQIFRAKPAETQRNKQSELSLSNGSLYLNGEPFHAGHLQAWQLAGWEQDIINKEPKHRDYWRISQRKTQISRGFQARSDESTLSFVEFIRQAFDALRPGEWVKAGALGPPLEVFYNGATHASASDICEAGWRWGCLARAQAGGEWYYQPVEVEAPEIATINPGEYLRTKRNDVLIDPQIVPYESLELLNRIADLRVNRGRLYAEPNVIKLGEAPEACRMHPVTKWLETHSVKFGRALEVVEARWGKLIVHENLLVARITDLSLRVKIEQKFEGKPDCVAFLSDEWVAFPRGLLRDVQQVVSRAGHVIKTVDAK